MNKIIIYAVNETRNREKLTTSLTKEVAHQTWNNAKIVKTYALTMVQNVRIAQNMGYKAHQ